VNIQLNIVTFTELTAQW